MNSIQYFLYFYDENPEKWKLITMIALKSFTLIISLAVNIYTFTKFYLVFRFYKSIHDKKIPKIKAFMEKNLDGKFSKKFLDETIDDR